MTKEGRGEEGEAPGDLDVRTKRSIWEQPVGSTDASGNANCTCEARFCHYSSLCVRTGDARTEIYQKWTPNNEIRLGVKCRKPLRATSFGKTPGPMASQGYRC